MSKTRIIHLSPLCQQVKNLIHQAARAFHPLLFSQWVGLQVVNLPLTPHWFPSAAPPLFHPPVNCLLQTQAVQNFHQARPFPLKHKLTLHLIQQ